MGQERCPREISGSRRGEDVLRAGSEIAGSSSAQERPCAATRLPLTSQHRRKPGTGGFTSYQFEPHLAHLLVSSSVVRTFYCTRASAAVVNQDVRIVGNCASARRPYATVLVTLNVFGAHLRRSDPLLQATRKRGCDDATI
jgi:hypothetical protein